MFLKGPITAAFESSEPLHLLRLGVSASSLHRESSDSLMYGIKFRGDLTLSADFILSAIYHIYTPSVFQYQYQVFFYTWFPRDLLLIAIG